MRTPSFLIVLALLGCADDPAATPADIVGLQEQIDGLEAALSELQSRNDLLATELADSKAALAVTTGRVAGHDVDLRGVTDRIDGHDEALDELAALVDGHDDAITTLASDLAAVSGGTSFSVLEDALAAQDARLTTVEDTYATITHVDAGDAAGSTALAGVDGRVAALEGAGFGGAIAGLDTRVAGLEASGASGATALAAVDTRLADLEDADLATETWVADQAFATEDWVEDQDYAEGTALTGLDTRVATLEDTELATEDWVESQGFAHDADVAALDVRTTALEGAGYATEDWVGAQAYAIDDDVDALEGRTTALEGAGFATETWVGTQAYASAASVMALDTRVSTLEGAGYATETWVGSQAYASAGDLDDLDIRVQGLETLDLVEASDLAGVDAEIDLLILDVTALDGRLDTVEGSYATQAWVTSRGYLTTAPDPWIIGQGLRVNGDTLEVDAGAGLTFLADALVVDSAEIGRIAQGVCYDTEAELLAVLGDDIDAVQTAVDAVDANLDTVTGDLDDRMMDLEDCPAGMVRVGGSFCIHPASPYPRGLSWRAGIAQCHTDGYRMCSQTEVVTALAAGSLEMVAWPTDTWYMNGSQSENSPGSTGENYSCDVQGNSDQSGHPQLSVQCNHSTTLTSSWRTLVCCSD